MRTRAGGGGPADVGNAEVALVAVQQETGRWIGARGELGLVCWWLLIYSSEIALGFMGRGLLIAASKVGDLEWEMRWPLASWAFLYI